MGLGAFQKSHALGIIHCCDHPDGVRLTSMSTVLESKKLVCGKSWGPTNLHMDTSGVTHTPGGGHSQVPPTG